MRAILCVVATSSLAGLIAACEATQPATSLPPTPAVSVADSSPGAAVPPVAPADSAAAAESTASASSSVGSVAPPDAAEWEAAAPAAERVGPCELRRAREFIRLSCEAESPKDGRLLDYGSSSSGVLNQEYPPTEYGKVRRDGSSVIYEGESGSFTVYYEKRLLQVSDKGLVVSRSSLDAKASAAMVAFNDCCAKEGKTLHECFGMPLDTPMLQPCAKSYKASCAKLVQCIQDEIEPTCDPGTLWAMPSPPGPSVFGCWRECGVRSCPAGMSCVPMAGADDEDATAPSRGLCVP